MMKRILVCTLLTLILAALFAPATLAAPAPAPIGKDDFVVRIGKTDFDILTHDIDVAIWSSGKKLKKTSFYAEGDAWVEYVLKAKEATFYLPESLDYCDRVALTKKGATARGIKLGSTLSALLAAYPAPEYVWEEGKTTTYTFQAPNAPETMPDSVAESLNSVRPVYFYSLLVTVNNKTNKVTDILISAQAG